MSRPMIMTRCACALPVLYLSLLIVLCVLRPARPDDGAERGSDIRRLHQDILPNDYRSMYMVRPVVYENTSMTITVTVKLSDFVTFELDKNEAVVQLRMCISWLAVTMQWDPANYNGLDKLVISPYEAWRPDIDVFNHVDVSSPLVKNNGNMLLLANGTVTWCPIVESTVSCDTDMSHFPHDEHDCVLLVGSASYSIEQLRLEPRLVRGAPWSTEEHTSLPALPQQQQQQSDLAVRSANWEMTDVHFDLIEGGDRDYYDYALHLRMRVRRRFSLHRYSLTLPLFVCGLLTLLFCWLPLDDDDGGDNGGNNGGRRFHLALLSVLLNLYLMVCYSGTLRHSTNTPWSLRFAGDLMLLTCCMIVLQIVYLALEDVVVPFGVHPTIRRCLNTTVIGAYVLSDRVVLINDDDGDDDDEEQGEGREQGEDNGSNNKENRDNRGGQESGKDSGSGSSSMARGSRISAAAAQGRPDWPGTTDTNRNVGGAATNGANMAPSANMVASASNPFPEADRVQRRDTAMARRRAAKPPSSVNQTWRNVLVAVMRIVATFFLAAYVFLYVMFSLLKVF